MRRLVLAVLLCLGCGRGATLAPQHPVAPAVLFVRAPGQPSSAAPADGSERRPFASIADALRDAPSGALLRLEAGIYQERLVVKRPVVLLGRGPGRTRIFGGEQGPLIEVAGADHVELRGLALEQGRVGLLLAPGSRVRLEDVALRGFSQAGVIGKGASLTVRGSEVLDIGQGRAGRGLELTGGTLDVRSMVLRGAGRRAFILRGTRAVLADVDAAWSPVSALQAVDGADVRVVRGRFEHLGGAALYAGGARLSVEGAIIAGNEYAVIGFRGAEVTVSDSELGDHQVAAVALVGSRGTVQRCHITRGGSDGAIAITNGSGLVSLLDNRIQEPGPMGLHITDSTVSARGNTITGARLDRQEEAGDAVFAINSQLSLDQNVLRGNAGSGVAMMASGLQLTGNGLIGNGRAGLLLLNRSTASARGNLFDRNGVAGVQVAETSRATLSRNRFNGNPRFDIDVMCGSGGGGVVTIDSGNTFAGEAAREHVCP